MNKNKYIPLGKSFLYKIFISILILIFVVCTILFTSTGLKLFLLVSPRLIGQSVKIKEIKGNLWGGFTAQNIDISNKKLDLKITFLKTKIDFNYLKKKTVYINSIDIGDISFKFKSDNSSQTIKKFPKKIGLPINLVINNINVNKIIYEPNKDVFFDSGKLSYIYLDNHHQFKIISLNSESTIIAGKIDLYNKDLFPIKGQVSFNPNSFSKQDINKKGYLGIINIDGNLKNTLLDANINGPALKLKTKANMSIFNNKFNIVRFLTLKIDDFNPRLLFLNMPIANLNLILDIKPDEKKSVLLGNLSLSNSKSNYINNIGIPIKNINGKFLIDADKINFSNFNVVLHNNGKLFIKGVLGEKWDINFDILPQIKISDFFKINIDELISGKIVLNGIIKKSNIIIDLFVKKHASNSVMKGEFSYDLSDSLSSNINFRNIELKSNNNSILMLNGILGLSRNDKINLTFKANKFNLALVSKYFDNSNLNGKVQFKRDFVDSLMVTSDIKNSSLFNYKFSAIGFLDFDRKLLQNSNFHFVLGKNKAHIKGNLGNVDDQLFVDIFAPNLGQIGFASGSIESKGYIAGKYDKLKVNLEGKANNLVVMDKVNIKNLLFDVKFSQNIKDKIFIKIIGNNIKFFDNIINSININSNGLIGNHDIKLNIDANILEKKYILSGIMRGGFNNDLVWDGFIDKLNIIGNLRLNVLNKIKVIVGKDVFQTKSAKISFMDGMIDLNSINWNRGKILSSVGKANNISVDDIKRIFKFEIPIRQDLRVNGFWNINQMVNSSKGVITGIGNIKIIRTSGDIFFPNSKKSVGISNLKLNIDIKNNTISAQLNSDTIYGKAISKLQLQQIIGTSFINFPLSGFANIDLENINKLKFLFPVHLSIGGVLKSNIKISGTLSNLFLYGPIEARNVIYQNLNNGLVFKDGILNANFDGKKLLIKELIFKSKNGYIKGIGYLSPGERKYIPSVSLDVIADKYNLFNRSDRKVTLTGNAKISYDEIKGFGLIGNVKLDEGTFTFPKSSMPKVDDDVIIVNGKVDKVSDNYLPLFFDINMDLNKKFIFSSHGLNVTMGGNLHFLYDNDKKSRLLGKVNVVKGNYKAYGQNLDIESGELTFQGPIANPYINIRAVRNNSPVGAGIAVKGLITKPDYHLFANTKMSERDNLSWLILGRASEGESDDQALAIAMGVAVFNDFDKTGLLNNIGTYSRQTRDINTGDLNPAEQIVTIGRYITHKIYLGYEYGLTSSEQAAKVIYRISQKFGLIFRLGTVSMSGEARYKVRYD